MYSISFAGISYFYVARKNLTVRANNLEKNAKLNLQWKTDQVDWSDYKQHQKLHKSAESLFFSCLLHVSLMTIGSFI